MKKLTLRELPLKGKKVLMRVDFNVPLTATQTISDDSRIVASLPSIRYVLDQGGALILMSHLGRPEGKYSAKESLKPCAERLSELLGKPVLMAPDCIGPEVEKWAADLKAGQVLLLENLRFHPGEEHPDLEPNFTASLAKLGDFYVNDAFGTAHRAHASTSLIASYFPHKAAAGFLMEKEIAALSSLLHHPKRPFYAIIGGSKISSKAGVIKNLLPLLDGLFIGGAMAYVFLQAQGFSMGETHFEAKELQAAQNVLKETSQKKIPLWLPLDLLIADSFSNEAKKRTLSVEEGIPKGWQGMGIGPKTVQEWSTHLKKASTIFWNGPLGVFEMPNFAAETFAIAKTLASSSAQVIVGGGDSVAAIEKTGLSDHFAHLSTGGGASLEFLELGHLPGIDSLSSN